tara:strand:- start:15 stop:890 length:876 start_codon:yes stop_codon:yes gene_type:complete
MQATVFGGSGFLGSHVCDLLSENGYKVIVFDKKKSSWIKKKQQMFIGDINNKIDVKKAISGSKIIYNFAGLADIEDCKKKPIDTIQQNILGNANIIEQSIKQKVKRYIFASSMYVYSKEGSFYRCSKRSSEMYLEEYSKLHKIKYTILRYGSLYGPRSNNTNGLYRIISNAIKKKKLFYEGNLDSIREYIHVKDAADLSLQILDRKYENKKIILTGSQNIRMSDLMLMIGEILNLKSKKIYFSKNKRITHYDITPYSFDEDLNFKLNSKLNIDLGQGILNLIKDIKNNVRN